jgi:monoamine oxidase
MIAGIVGASESPILDLAVIGGGVAGTAVAHTVQQDRPDWAIGLFERTERIGGRLRSLGIDDLGHPIELGGMRFLTSHPLVSRLVDNLRLTTHAFDPTPAETERSFLRGFVGTAGTDRPGRGYDLPVDQRGRSAFDLAAFVFNQIVPGFEGLDHDGYEMRRATGEILGRPVIDWAIGDALEAFLGSEGHRFVNDVFGYDSGMRAFCAPDLVEFLSDGGDPTAEARTPDAGMDRIPRELASAFEERGGKVLMSHELATIEVHDGSVTLRFTNGGSVEAAHVVLALPVPALRLLAATSAALRSPAFETVFASVEPFPAMKLYLWYERAWWRPAVLGIRTTTDLALRKVFYFDGVGGSRSALLAMYTDGRDVEPWAALYEGGPPGSAAPAALLAEVDRQLRLVHPEVTHIPLPAGSSLMYWGADPHEVGWHFWRAGYNSDQILVSAPQPEPNFPIYLANEAFSRHQSWVEGALESAAAAVQRLATAAPAR